MSYAIPVAIDWWNVGITIGALWVVSGLLSGPTPRVRIQGRRRR